LSREKRDGTGPEAAVRKNAVYGARALKRTIQQEIQNTLAMKILAGEFREGDAARIEVNSKNEFVFSRK
jgi:ATP-dependent Clp protease ATP-binding subunit ClpB